MKIWLGPGSYRVGTMHIELGKIAREGIDLHVGGDPVAATRAALKRYKERLCSDSPPPALPPFPTGGGEEGPATALELEVALDADVEAAIECQARRANASTSEIAVHALLVYLAEIDAG